MPEHLEGCAVRLGGAGELVQLADDQTDAESYDEPFQHWFGEEPGR